MENSKNLLDYNVEFAHIYGNESFSHEHYQASQILKRKIEELEKNKQSYTTTILIDDYNPSEWILNVDKFLEELKGSHTVPDHLAYESKLVPLKDMVLELSSEQIRKGYNRYSNKKNGRVACSLLVAIWHLTRLGIFSLPKDLLVNGNKPFSAKKLVTILPERYHNVEEKALKVIGSTPSHRRVRDLEY